MTRPLIDTAKLEGLTLARGGHATPESGLCLMEAVAYVRGVPHTDHPACVSPVLGEMGRSLNDVLPDGLRQELIPLIPDLPGSAGDGHDTERSYLALDWMIRTWLPAWLELSPACRDAGEKIRELGQIVDRASAEFAGPVVRRAAKTASAARAAAWDAAWDAAWATAWDAAWDAARAAAWDAAGAAAWDAAGAAARDAAGDALQPTVALLQRSAIGLYDRMVHVGDPR